MDFRYIDYISVIRISFLLYLSIQIVSHIFILIIFACIFAASSQYAKSGVDETGEGPNLNWDQLIEFQFKCLKNGLNGIGIPDLIVAQNAKQNHCEIYSLDSHFKLMKDILRLQLTG